MPVPAGGLVQPVSVAEVARLLAHALSLPRTCGSTYEVGGARLCTLEDLLQEVSGAVNGGPRRVVRIPGWALRLGARVLERALPHPPLTSEQAGMMEEPNVCSLAPLRRDFGFQPADLGQSLRGLLASQ